MTLDIPQFEKVTLFGTATCADCLRSRAELSRLGVEYDDIDIAADGDAAELAQAISGRTSTPVIVFPDGEHLVEPSNDELGAKLRSLAIV
ncbi:glutaredoxin family protein [Lysinimonas soli]|uniref:Glutaredoxin family protein n=1 Tax=Lysinimonas soli TaxID=1074233 RepID=A0ABW0NSL7_9MICO